MEWENKMVSVGIDLHTTQFTVCAMAPSGEVFHREEYPMNDEGLENFISWGHEVETSRGAWISMAIEATGNARFFRNVMKNEGFTVLVINTLKFKVIVASAKKTDRHDAEVIARFLSKDLIPESYLCNQETEELRKLLCERADLVGLTVRTKNRIHNMMRGYGIETTGAQFQSKKKRQQLLKDLEDQKLYTEHAASTLKMLIDTLEAIEEQVKNIEALIDNFVMGEETVEILKTIPGVGKITASIIRAYVGDIDRFDSYKQFAAYCGLTPFVKMSNGSGFTGHVTKGGPVELRTAMVQAVMGMLRMQRSIGSISLIVDYRKMKKAKGSGKSIVAFARKLSRIIYVMLKRKETFNIGKLFLGKYDDASIA